MTLWAKECVDGGEIIITFKGAPLNLTGALKFSLLIFQNITFKC